MLGHVGRADFGQGHVTYTAGFAEAKNHLHEDLEVVAESCRLPLLIRSGRIAVNHVAICDRLVADKVESRLLERHLPVAIVEKVVAAHIGLVVVAFHLLAACSQVAHKGAQKPCATVEFDKFFIVQRFVVARVVDVPASRIPEDSL